MMPQLHCLKILAALIGLSGLALAFVLLYWRWQDRRGE
jgi:hypothetical protein